MLLRRAVHETLKHGLSPHETWLNVRMRARAHVCGVWCVVCGVCAVCGKRAACAGWLAGWSMFLQLQHLQRVLITCLWPLIPFWSRRTVEAHDYDAYTRVQCCVRVCVCVCACACVWLRLSSHVHVRVKVERKLRATQESIARKSFELVATGRGAAEM